MTGNLYPTGSLICPLLLNDNRLPLFESRRIIFPIYVFIYFSHNVNHYLLDIDVFFCRRLKVTDSVLWRNFHGFAPENGPVCTALGISQVNFISNKHFRESSVRRVPVNTIYPTLYIVEGFLLGQIESYYHTVGLAVKLLSYSVEPLLTRSVPYFHIYYIKLFWLLFSCISIAVLWTKGVSIFCSDVVDAYIIISLWGLPIVLIWEALNLLLANLVIIKKRNLLLKERSFPDGSIP